MRHAPTAPVVAACARRVSPLRCRRDVVPPWSRQSSTRAVDPRVDRMIGRLETEHEQRAAVVARRRDVIASVGSSSRQLVGNSPDCATARVASTASREVGEVHARRRLEDRAVLHAHPRLGDDAERALRAEEEAIGRRSRARAGKAPRLDDATGRHHADRLHQVVDVRVDATRSDRRIAWPANRRASRTRTTAGSGEACSRAAGAALRAPDRARHLGCARRARPCRPRARGRVASGRSVTTPRVAVVDETGLDAADDRGASAERHRGHSSPAHQSSSATTRLRRGKRDDVGRTRRTRRASREPHRGTTCRRCARRARGGRRCRWPQGNPVDARAGAGRSIRSRLRRRMDLEVRHRIAVRARPRASGLDRDGAPRPPIPNPTTSAGATYADDRRRGYRATDGPLALRRTRSAAERQCRRRAAGVPRASPAAPP